MKPLKRFTYFQAFLILGLILSAVPSSAWFDETHLAIAKTAGYSKWYHAAGNMYRSGQPEGFGDHPCILDSSPAAGITPLKDFEPIQVYGARIPFDGRTIAPKLGDRGRYREIPRPKEDFINPSGGCCIPGGSTMVYVHLVRTDSGDISG